VRAAFLLLLVCSGCASELDRKLDDFLSRTIEAHRIPGLAVAVTRGREIVYLRAFGTRNLDTREPLSTDSLFHMASVSKPFVATAIVQLVEKGAIDLDAPVTRYLPYFRLADERSSEITIRQMLQHTSGMPDVEDYEWDRPQLDEGAAERYVRSLSGESLIGPPGQQWRYSNIAFDTLGDVIAKVSGQSFEDYEKSHILDPLGMKESTFVYPDTRAELRTTGHVWDLDPKVSAVYPYNRRHAPSSTLNSSVVEMTRWAWANLNRGELDGTRILEEKSYDLMWRPSAKVSETVDVGLSWFLEERGGTRVVSHSGGDTGYSSYCALLLDEDVAVILASNYDRTPMSAIRNGIIDIVLGHEATVPPPSVAYPFARTLVDRGIEAAKARYRELSATSRGEYGFDERELNTLGYYFLSKEDAERAVQVLAFNAELFPDSSNAHDSLGEAYAKAGDRERALESYRRALELDPSSASAAKALETLQP
jgi:CubicO group peptidase (beta-lactamase class C family)